MIFLSTVFVIAKGLKDSFCKILAHILLAANTAYHLFINV